MQASCHSFINLFKGLPLFGQSFYVFIVRFNFKGDIGLCSNNFKFTTLEYLSEGVFSESEPVFYSYSAKSVYNKYNALVNCMSHPYTPPDSQSKVGHCKKKMTHMCVNGHTLSVTRLTEGCVISQLRSVT